MRAAIFILALVVTGQSLAAEYIPEIKRREVVTPNLDTDNFEIGALVSLLSVQDFTVEPRLSMHFTYHLNESYFLEGSFGQADIGISAAEGNTPAFEDRSYTDYHLSFGWNILPGEAYFGTAKKGNKRTYNQNFYLLGGAGVTNFANDNAMTLHLGGGYRVLLTDKLAVRFEAKDFITSIDEQFVGNRGRQHNLTIGVGASLFF